ncbi:MAG: class I SAM-dependent methyltransferase [Candidatus Shapirobacteria bacterium]|nr:class I SAM-dependent methyltransferase [Candidatus Shapirobacteria bacterium]
MQKNTSWEKVGDWYNETVGEKGSYYHQQVILPNVIRLMKLGEKQKLLDVGCGQGILGKSLPNHNGYWGIDLAANLIEMAKKDDKNLNHKYLVADATKDFKTTERFDWITLILALQNMDKPFKVIQNCKNVLGTGGKILMVLNHPAFRIPKHSDWEMKEGKQYRLIESYMSPLEISIDSSPFDKHYNQKTVSYHYPLSAYSEMLTDNGFVIETIEEWVSNKKSTGVKALIEDKAREEIPLFLTIVAKKI